MTLDPAGASAPNIIERVKNILLKPQTEFDRIAGEPADVAKLYTGYVLPLAVLAALCGFVGMSIIGASPGFGMTFRVPIVAGLVGGVIQVVMALVGVFITAVVANALAPTFGSQQNLGQAHKLAAYSSTAGFLAGVFTLIPALSGLAIVGLYSLALLFIGIPRLMKTPEDKRIMYFLAIVVVSVVLGVVLSWAVGTVQRAIPGVGASNYSFAGGSPTRPTPEAEITLPGGGAIDLSDIERAGKAYAEGAPAIDPARLQQILPQTLPGGFRLTSSSSASAMGSSQAEGAYESGEARLRLTIVHMGAMGAVATMAAGLNIAENRSDENGYARTQTINGRVYAEEVNNANRSARYAVIGQGVAITVEGSNGVTLDQARAVAETLDIRRLENEFRR